MQSVSFWASHDGLHHIFRLASFDATLRSGVLFPRWADELGFGYGFPVTHYYAPLAYYLAALFHLLGAGILDSLKLTFALGFLLSAFSMYRLARDVVARPAALLAALAYTYYPYHVADAYMRGTLTEFFALALLPLIVWLVRRALRATTLRLQLIYTFVGALALAALILTHNLSAFLFLPALVLYALLAHGRAWLRVGARLAALVALAFALAAFYLLPALGEVAWIRAGQVSGSVDEIASLLTPITQFVVPALAQPYVPDAPAALQHPLALSVALLSVAAIVVTAIARARLSAAQRAEWLAWLALALLITVAMLDLSAPLWANVRPLAFVQFPYRLHAVLGLALAMLIGLGAQAAMLLARDHQRPIYLAQFAVGLVWIATALGALTLAPQALPGHKEPISEAQVNRVGASEYDYQTALWTRLYGGPWLLEYMPAWVTAAREEFFLPAEPRAASAPALSAPQITVRDYRPQARALHVQSAEPFPLSFHTFYFPAWQVRVDGAPVSTYPSGPLGLVGAQIPAGEHAVTLSFEATPLQRLGEVITLTALAFAMLLVLVRGQHKRLWLTLVLLVLVSVLGWRSLEMRPSQSLRPAAASFDAQIDLIGYELSRESVRPGEFVELTLYWFARQAPRENYKVFVHLDGPTRVGQVDAQPGLNFSPTTRWQRGEIIADHYRVRVAPSAAPGRYELFTGLYRTQPLQNLRVVSEQAAPGDRLRLGALEVR